MIRLVRRFFEDIHRLANFVTANPMQDILVTLSSDDRKLLENYRRYAPRAKKALVNQDN